MLVDPHVHTSIGSPDSKISPQQLIAKAKRRGMDAICLTDHNSYKGVKETQEMGQKEGVLVIKGIEMDTKYGHILVYGVDVYEFLRVDKVILKEQIESRSRICLEDLREIFFSVIPSFEIDKLIDEVHAKSGAVILPHPFGKNDPGQTTMRHYLDLYFEEISSKHGNRIDSIKIKIEELINFVQNRDPTLFAVLKKVNGIEVLNPLCSWVENQAAFVLAEYLGKNTIGCSDAHIPEQVGTFVTVFPSNIKCERDFIHHLGHRNDLEPRINFMQDKLGSLDVITKWLLKEYLNP